MAASGSRRDRVKQYALGIATEVAWILGLAFVGWLLALIARVIWP